MTLRSSREPMWGLAALMLATLTACATVNRTDTLNEITAGPTAAAAVQQQLAKQGLTDAHVTCAKTLVADAGTTTTCSLSAAGTKKIVRFTFDSASGEVKLSSVKAS